MIVDIRTGSCSLTVLPPQNLGAGYTSLYGWGRSGLLLVRHTGQDGSTVLSCFNTHGVCAHTVQVPLDGQGLPALIACWVPSAADTVLVHNTTTNRAGPDLWLWHIADSRVQHLNTAPRMVVSFTLSPCGCKLLGCCDQGICLVDLVSLAVTHQVPDGVQYGGSAAWGEQGIAVQVAAPVAHNIPWQLRPGRSEYMLFSVRNTAVQHVRNQLFEVQELRDLAFAPDGAHLALTLTAGLSSVVLIHAFLTGPLGQYDMPFAAGALSWGPAGDKVLVSEREGSRHLLLDFG